MDEKGGFLQAAKIGFIQDQIKTTAQKRDMNIAMRKDILLGTNQFPNFDETITDDFDEKIVRKGWSTNVESNVLKTYRGAQAFEELRLATEKSGKRPKAFMLTYGNIAMRKARATFACNFFACAGIEVVDNNGFATVSEGTKAAINAKADIVVICSSDDEYADIVIPALEQLKDKATVVVAGYPKAILKKLQEAGVKHFIHSRSNILETLKQIIN